MGRIELGKGLKLDEGVGQWLRDLVEGADRLGMGDHNLRRWVAEAARCRVVPCVLLDEDTGELMSRYHLADAVRCREVLGIEKLPQWMLAPSESDPHGDLWFVEPDRLQAELERTGTYFRKARHETAN
jgi:hypothetical protein